MKLGRVPQSQYEGMASEILTALKKLGDHLSPAELQFLNDHSSQSLKDFQKVDSNLGSISPMIFRSISHHRIGQEAQAKVLNVAGAQVKNAAKK